MIHIRHAIKNEVKVLQNLNDEVFIDNQKYDTDLDMNWAKSEKGKKYFKDLLNNPEAICFIAEENANPVGYIAAGPKTVSYRKSKYLEIENMGVIPEYRSKGIGGMLIEECLKWGKSQGFQKVFVNAYFDNKEAIEFYKMNGFEEIDVSLEKTI